MFLSEVDREKYPNVKQKYRFELISELVEHEGSILHTKGLEERLRSIITEINEEVDYWFYLLEAPYKRYLANKQI